MLRVLIIAIATFCGLSASFGQELANPCVMFGPSYRLNSDVVNWSMTLNSGQRCFRGVRANLTVLSEIKILEAPRNGRLVLEGVAFVYQGNPNFVGEDAFSFLVSGRTNQVRGTSIIRVAVSVK